MEIQIFFFSLFACLLNHIDSLVITNKKTHDYVVSYADVTQFQITFFLKEDINSNENKVLLYDI